NPQNLNQSQIAHYQLITNECVFNKKSLLRSNCKLLFRLFERCLFFIWKFEKQKPLPSNKINHQPKLEHPISKRNPIPFHHILPCFHNQLIPPRFHPIQFHSLRMIARRLSTKNLPFYQFHFRVQ
ncbi:MAG: hypothetical protein ACI9JY_001617, partial [Saprospiraceae bacterium]